MKGDKFLSDVHLDKVAHGGDVGEEVQVTRFKFISQSSSSNAALSVQSSSDDDDDDDLKVDRATSQVDDTDVISIRHHMATDLQSVGAQVWRGSLLLCDYISANPGVFRGRHCVELGAGTGLVGVVLGQFVKTAVCTDALECALELCRTNLKENERFVGDRVRVERLDWFHVEPADLARCTDDATSILLVADCVYDEEITDALMDTVEAIMRRLSPHHDVVKCFFAMEKRYNFSVTELRVVCNAYDHFRRRLQALVELQCGFDVTEISDFSQFFCYERTNDLELLCLSLRRVVCEH